MNVLCLFPWRAFFVSLITDPLLVSLEQVEQRMLASAVKKKARKDAKDARNSARHANICGPTKFPLPAPIPAESNMLLHRASVEAGVQTEAQPTVRAPAGSISESASKHDARHVTFDNIHSTMTASAYKGPPSLASAGTSVSRRRRIPEAKKSIVSRAVSIAFHGLGSTV